jgi:thiol-disulfide isomerase/thioredoxin
MKEVRKALTLLVSGLLLIAVAAASLAGCGENGKVTVLIFYTEGNASAEEFKTTLDEAEKKYEGEVVFEYVDLDDPENKARIEEYLGENPMDPTYVILNTEGKVKQTFMGKPHEQMFMSAIEGLIPRDGEAPVTTSPGAPADSIPMQQDTAPGGTPDIPGVAP